ncbi:MAG TPA: hypothetical protein DEP78_09060 [Verrucomicrobiales bacterium]|nr:hypothetical protein [Verrucomicrobiales bacterium]
MVRFGILAAFQSRGCFLGFPLILVNTFQKLFFEVGWRCSANEGRNMRLDTFASKRFFIFLQGDRKANAKKSS